MTFPSKSAGVVAASVALLLSTVSAWARLNPRNEARQEWYRSYAPSTVRWVKIAVVTGGTDRIKRAAVKETGNRIRITLVRTSSAPLNTADTAEVTLSCVEVRLKSPAGSRRRIDGSTGRAPDRAKPGSADARDRADTELVDLEQGYCQPLRTNFYG